MANKLERSEEIANQSLEFFDAVSSERKTPKELSVETGLSLRTIYNRIDDGRQIIYEQLKEMGERYLSEIWIKYEYIWKEAKIQWDATHNVLFLKEMKGVLEAQRRMLAVDAPSKAPITDNESKKQDSLIMVFNDNAYKAAEQKDLEEKNAAIEGEVVKLDETSTKVLLTPENNELE